ncbi:hypothetical protein FNF27_05032 [Cafeteria roenbergensis]|uniref:Gamma-glutamyltransferase n=2 Tax=Cafeteria roenbergensis TaxID=33653 RepID=A0A5A8CWF1_CAFRO|nr:hypothetical protein FNF29_00657 [Cafeteria roenbergensis]KAA0173537.1 hypothetical protein FNF27_05032 [Cafeteria roenbergensis]|eukprot:KAA0157305.1 hypothetical protein FNF29_00657 [Cafeteria roenbergensis]
MPRLAVFCAIAGVACAVGSALASRTVEVEARSGQVQETSDPEPAQRCCLDTTGAPPAEAPCGGDRWTGRRFATRSVAMGLNGAAASSVPLVTQTAIDILKAGGTAVDAAIAANAMQALTEPMSNGLGGDLFAIVWDPATRQLVGYNGSGRSPKGLSFAELVSLLDGSETLPIAGPLSVSTPGAARGWCDLAGRFASMPLSRLLAPAIEYARKGFPVTQVIAAEWAEAFAFFEAHRDEITSGGRFPGALDGFYQTYTVEHKVGGRPPAEGEVFTNPALANTLETLAAGGCEAFYNGSIAAQLDSYARSVGLYLRADDLAAHHGEFVEPRNVSYRRPGLTVHELPPNPQGIAALQMLNMLELVDVAAMGHNSADYLHYSLEAKKLVFADRAKYYADPDFASVPVEGLISKAYARERAALINMTRAAKVVPAGDPPGMEAGDTIYLSTADSSGMMVSWIQSNYYPFGSGLAPPALGFALQNRGNLFRTWPPTAANVYAPGKRPFHTLMPGAIMQDGEPLAVFGVMGGAMQPQGSVQVAVNMIDFGMNAQEAGDAARWRHSGSQQPTGTNMTDGGIVMLEGGVCGAARQELQARGHTLAYADGSFGGYEAIIRDPVTRVYQAGTDKRKDGRALAY